MQLESYLSEEVRSLLFSLLKRVLSLVSLERLILYKRATERPFLVQFYVCLFAEKKTQSILQIIINPFDVCWKCCLMSKVQVLFRFRSSIVCVATHMIREGGRGISFAVDIRSVFEAAGREPCKQKQSVLSSALCQPLGLQTLAAALLHIQPVKSLFPNHRRWCQARNQGWCCWLLVLWQGCFASKVLPQLLQKERLYLLNPHGRKVWSGPSKR